LQIREEYSRDIKKHTGLLSNHNNETSEEDTRKEQTYQQLLLFERQVERTLIEQVTSYINKRKFYNNQ
jgi:hypothetical protein